MVIDGRYRIVRKLGSGGMADVWLADDAQLNRKVALKVLHDRFAQDEQFVERFRREAEAAAGLQHPNVVGIFDRGEVDGTYYIAMQYVQGTSLKEPIESGLIIPQAVAIIRQILSAARFAHDHGIVHRDLKPQNVLVDTEDRVLVADFGIARAGHSEITQTGSVMGTAQYLSPEQAQGLEVGPASDLYSIGVLLYEALTGRVPFEAESAVAVALKQVSEPPTPPTHFNPKISPALESVVMKALVKDPAARFASAAEFLSALDEAEVHPGVPIGQEAPPVAAVTTAVLDEGWSRRRWAMLAAAGVALGVIIAALLLTGVFSGDKVTVPDVVKPGLNVEEARAILSAAGLEASEQGQPSDADAGQVLESNPPAGAEVDDGSTVLIIFSEGPGEGTVPDVIGLLTATARERIEAAGFDSKVTSEFSDEVEAGRVIRMSPPAGTETDRGELVTLVVSKGADVVEVPDVLGQSQGSAEAELDQAGFFADVDTGSSTATEGTVFEQQPSAGSSAQRGSSVTIVVSEGPGTVTVPDVLGKDRDEAAGQLNGLGLDVEIDEVSTDDPKEDGEVIDQFPRAGTQANPGQTVTIRVGIYEEPDPEPPTTTTTTTQEP